MRPLRVWPIAFVALLLAQLLPPIDLGAQSHTTYTVNEEFHQPAPLGLIEPDVPLNDPLTRAKVDLGRTLFFDTRLSGSETTSCATCHMPDRAFTEPRQTSRGDSGLRQDRNAMSLLNAGYMATFGWDGQFRSLEEQALDPFRITGDMGINLGDAISVIEADADYVQAFDVAFGEGPTSQTLGRALAAYQRSLLSGGSRFDSYLFGGDGTALSSLEKAGWELFTSQAGCINCHDVFHRSVNPLGGASHSLQITDFTTSELVTKMGGWPTWDAMR